MNTNPVSEESPRSPHHSETPLISLSPPYQPQYTEQVICTHPSWDTLQNPHFEANRQTDQMTTNFSLYLTASYLPFSLSLLAYQLIHTMNPGPNLPTAESHVVRDYVIRIGGDKEPLEIARQLESSLKSVHFNLILEEVWYWRAVMIRRGLLWLPAGVAWVMWPENVIGHVIWSCEFVTWLWYL